MLYLVSFDQVSLWNEVVGIDLNLIYNESIQHSISTFVALILDRICEWKDSFYFDFMQA